MALECWEEAFAIRCLMNIFKMKNRFHKGMHLNSEKKKTTKFYKLCAHVRIQVYVIDPPIGLRYSNCFFT